ncbi:glucose/mannose transport system substrate-binding protein [Kaistia soli DSM 19436]|uniref:Glucose/mannose transport system substrate-binding protein n=1 Tax=Kaistia soli DSM 19436 TaxID=1122133 RepID=A0A1M5EAD7_9HYPH|nr:ABC transporter substrate-binding protein [Kaistia soli]SHF76199.1 glucose/mannose transport system substrate-binding protein [Kaistia soli DSM 19436]
MTFNRRIAALAAATALVASVGTAQATDLTLFHTWSNESEMKALNTIIDKYQADTGNKVQAASVPHETAGESPLVSLFVAGTPPNLFIAADASFFKDLDAKGQAFDVGPLFEKTGVTKALPETVLQAITIDGKVLKIPTAVHLDGMVYFSEEVAKKAGVDPTKWTSLDDMWADQKKVEDAGFTFIAIGGNSFQAGYTFHALLAAIAGPEIYNRFYADTPDKTVFDDPAVRQTIETFRKIAAQADPGWVNRSWNDTTNTVIAGKALMQIHGDWMKGQWRANDKKAGVDFGCLNIPGTKAVSVTVDSFGLLGGVDATTAKAEEDFASVVVDPKINAEFAFYKGSSPVRLDVPTDKLDVCNTLVLDDLKKPNFSVENPFYIADGDWINSVWNTMFTLQGDPNMSTDDGIKMLKSEYDAIFK